MLLMTKIVPGYLLFQLQNLVLGFRRYKLMLDDCVRTTVRVLLGIVISEAHSCRKCGSNVDISET